MKSFKYYLISPLLLMFFCISYGMKRAYVPHANDPKQQVASYGVKKVHIPHDNVPRQTYNAQIQTYFAPGDRKAMKDDLFSLLDKATRSIYVAMYWVTDNSLIDKLIAAKKRGVTVEVYVDESSPNIMVLVEKLLRNDIVPIVFPSQLRGTGIMHDKFFIIDFEVVVTGSANFTRAAFDDTAQIFNYENTVMIHSHEIASQFFKNFIAIQVGIFEAYIDMIADYELKSLPAWFNKLWPVLFKKESRLPRTLYSRTNRLNDMQRDRVNLFRTIMQI